MQQPSPASFQGLALAPDNGGGELARLIDGIAASAEPAPKKRHKAPRPGLRGPGSKPPRQRNESFEPDYDAVVAQRGEDREKRAKRKAERDEELTKIAEAEGLTLREWRDRELDEAMKRVGAYVAWMEKARAKVWTSVYSEQLASSGCSEERARNVADAAVTVFNKAPPFDPDMPHLSKEDRRLVNDVERAQTFSKRLQDEATRDANGVFHWPGGLVADKYYRAPFSMAGKKSDRHPHYKRIAASAGKASKGNLLAGDTKDSCHRHARKLYALDKPQVHFAAVCKDMFRLDLDVDFASYEELRSFIEYKAKEHNLPAGPHVAAWYPDDRAPGEANRPHLYVILPDDCAVWPHSSDREKNMLKAVIKGLQEVFGADKGGTVHPYSGKNPLSWLTEFRIVEPKRMPTLAEWFEALGCEWVPDGMPDDISIENLHDAAQAFEKELAAWWRVVRGVTFSTGHALYKSGKIDLDDRDGFAKKAKRAISGPLTKALKPAAGKQAQRLAEMIDSATSYMARTFDPSKLDRDHRNRGAAAHLIEPGMTQKEREAVGGTYSGPVRIGKSVAMLAEIIRLDLICRRKPTIASVADRGRCYNTVKRHWDEAYALAKSRISS